MNKFAKDSLLNLISSAICTVTLQIIVYPILASRFSETSYGTILTIMGIVNLFISTLGNTLNNSRLLLDNGNAEARSQNGYNRILLAVIPISIVGIVFILKFIYRINEDNYFLVCLLTVIGVCRAYFIVIFRIKLDFTRQTISNIILCSGYVIGLFLVRFTNIWVFTFLFGEFFSLVYSIKKSKFLSEGFRNSEDIRKIVILYSQLTAGSLIGNSISYFDRITLYPLIGAEAIAIFSVASFWGRSISLVVEPIANVILSYATKLKTKIKYKTYFLFMGISALFSAIAIFSGYFLAPLICSFLYPDLIDSAKGFINICTTAFAIGACGSLARPINLVLCKQKYLVILQATHLVVYLTLSMYFVKNNGLYGFCIATLYSNLLYVFMQYGVGFLSLRIKNKKTSDHKVLS